MLFAQATQFHLWRTVYSVFLLYHDRLIIIIIIIIIIITEMPMIAIKCTLHLLSNFQAQLAQFCTVLVLAKYIGIYFLKFLKCLKILI